MHATTSAAGRARNTTSAISSTFLITAIMVGSNLRGYRLHRGLWRHPQGLLRLSELPLLDGNSPCGHQASGHGGFLDRLEQAQSGSASGRTMAPGRCQAGGQSVVQARREASSSMADVPGTGRRDINQGR